MMKKSNPIVFSFATILIVLFQACDINCVQGVGNEVRKTIQVPEFTELQLRDDIQVHITQGSPQKIEAKGQENLIGLINTELNGDRWNIEYTECINSKNDFEIFVTVPDLTRIELDGSGSIVTENTLKGELLEIQLNGPGNMDLEVQVKELSTELNGSGDLKLEGSTKRNEIELDGSGDIDAEDLSSDVVKVNLNGSGDVRVNVSYEIDVKVNGSGDVFYKGDVKNIRSDIDGSGNLHQLNDN